MRLLIARKLAGPASFISAHYLYGPFLLETVLEMAAQSLDIDPANTLVIRDAHLPGLMGNTVTIGVWTAGLFPYSPALDGDRLAALLDPVFRDQLDRTDRQFLAWKASIPAHLLAQALRSPHPFSTLMRAASSDYAAQLLDSAPVLFFLLVDTAVRQAWSRNQFDQAVKNKRSVIIALVLGKRPLHVSSMLKFLNKLRFDDSRKADLVSLFDVLRNNQHLSYSHHRAVHLSLFSLPGAQQFLPSLVWLSKLDDNLVALAGAKISGLLFMSGRMNFQDLAVQKIMRVSNLDDLLDLHQVTRAGYDTIAGLAKKGTFPSPPLKGTRRVLPISDVWALFNVAMTQDNCVLDYVDQVLDGSYYFYVVPGDKLATLGVKVLGDGMVLVDQLLAKSNAPVASDVQDMVDQWLGNSMVISKSGGICRAMADYKVNQLNQLMVDYHNYCNSYARTRPGNAKYRASYKAAQTDQIMSDYMDYCRAN